MININMNLILDFYYFYKKPHKDFNFMGMSLKDPISSTPSFKLRYPKPGESEELGTILCLAVDLGCKQPWTDSQDTLGHGVQGRTCSHIWGWWWGARGMLRQCGDTQNQPEHGNSVSSVQRGLTCTCSRQPHAIKSGRVMKFHLICQEESANVKRHLIKRGRFFERKPLSNYFKCLRPTHQNIYISVSQRQSVIKLVQHLHSILVFFFRSVILLTILKKRKASLDLIKSGVSIFLMFSLRKLLSKLACFKASFEFVPWDWCGKLTNTVQATRVSW